MVLSRSSFRGGQARDTARTLLVPLVLLLGFLAFPSPALGAGALDPTFDGDGKVVTDLGGDDQASGVAIQSDGKIVVAGGDGDNFVLARYNTDGSLDLSFDGDGKVVTDFGGTERAFGIAVQSDGKIVAVGFILGDDFAVARYNSDGSLDSSFNTDGKVTTDFGGRVDDADAVAIQADGKIVVAGGSAVIPDYDFALARYNPDGSLDPTFGGDGKVVIDNGSDFAHAVAIQGDGKILAAGSDDCQCAMGGVSVLNRYNTDGSLDPSFDGDGKVQTDLGGPFSYAYGVVIQGDGKIVTGGATGYAPDNDFALARYNTNGSLDPNFDLDGKVVTDFGDDDNGRSVAIQADGKIVAAGYILGGSNPRSFALARYNTNGSLDPNFDFDGRVTTDFGADETAQGVAIGSGGRIIAAGATGTSGGDADFALARYTSTGTTLPKLALNDVTRFEGNAGLTAFAFKASLSTASSQTITVSRQTANGSATAPSDYTALAPATISFAPGETTKTVVVKVKSDLALEPNEGFFLKLSNPTGATIADGQGKGTIQNDDLSASASCTITGTNRSEVLNGTAGNDVICGGRGDDEIYGVSGNDVLKGEDGDDLLVGGDGYDLLLSGIGVDDLRGGVGNDTLRGGDQADTLLGGPNSDALFGEIGADSLNSKDTVSANDSANGGADSDSCTVDSGDFVMSCP